MPLLKGLGMRRPSKSNRGVIEVAEPLASCAKIHDAIKIRILFFYPSTVRYNLAEENHPSGKFHLTLNSSPTNLASHYCRVVQFNLKLILTFLLN
jgi:hypothetical protein